MSLALDSWFTSQLAANYAPPASIAPTGGLMLGCPCWGEDYIDRLRRFCLPSLLAPVNQQALRDLGAELVLFTDTASIQALLHASAPLARAGIHTLFIEMPPEIAAGADKYRLLAAAQGLLMLQARARGRAFHPLHPDHLHGEGYFKAMGRLGATHDAMAHGNVWVDIFAAGPEIDTYRRGDAIVMPAKTLGGMGLRRLHPEHRPSLLVPGAELPKSHILMWPGREALHYACPHMNPVWLSAKAVATTPIVYPVTLDAELPTLWPIHGQGGGYHVPAAADGMVLVELAGDDKTPSGKLPDVDAWTRLAWGQMSYDQAFLPIYRQRTAIPVDQPHPQAIGDDEIDREHASLMEALAVSRVEAFDEWLAQQRRFRLPFLI